MKSKINLNLRFAKVGLIAALSVGGTAAAQTLSEYQNNCASCHGTDGKATNSQVLDLLKTAPADLTTLSKRNNGVFPFDRVYAVIDGRETIKSHGQRDMPAWGARYASSDKGAKAAEYFFDMRMPYDMEMYARSRIVALADYLRRIQVK